MKKQLLLSFLGASLVAATLTQVQAAPIELDKLMVSGVYATGDMDGADGSADDYTQLRLNLAYQMGDQWAIETGLFSGGLESEKSFAVADYSSEIDLFGLNAGIRGSYPLADQWSVYGRAGLFFWDGDAEVTVKSVTGSTVTEKESDSGVDFYAGAGMSYHYGKWDFSLDFERLSALDDAVNLFGAGVGYRF